jgi:phosphate transport system substrate-binding protein
MKKIFIYLVVLSFLFTGCKEKLLLSGSETLHQTALYLANEYMKQTNKYTVEVFGGGSQEGINKLKSKQTDLALISRELTEEEKNYFKDKISIVTVAYDGAGIIVHPSNKVETIHLEQASAIFSGEIQNWKELGGENKPIQVVLRNDMSGTAVFFKEHIVQKKDLAEKYDPKRDYIKNAKIVQDNSELIDYISKTPNSIGYIGMGWANSAKDKVKLLKYSRHPEEEKVVPNLENIINRKYKLARGLFFVYETNNSKAEDFISFCTSEKGQQAIQKTGYLRSTLPEVEVKASE